MSSVLSSFIFNLLSFIHMKYTPMLFTNWFSIWSTMLCNFILIHLVNFSISAMKFLDKNNILPTHQSSQAFEPRTLHDKMNTSVRRVKSFSTKTSDPSIIISVHNYWFSHVSLHTHNKKQEEQMHKRSIFPIIKGLHSHLPCSCIVNYYNHWSCFMQLCNRMMTQFLASTQPYDPVWTLRSLHSDWNQTVFTIHAGRLNRTHYTDLYHTHTDQQAANP